MTHCQSWKNLFNLESRVTNFILKMFHIRANLTILLLIITIVFGKRDCGSSPASYCSVAKSCFEFFNCCNDCCDPMRVDNPQCSQVGPGVIGGTLSCECRQNTGDCYSLSKCEDFLVCCKQQCTRVGKADQSSCVQYPGTPMADYSDPSKTYCSCLGDNNPQSTAALPTTQPNQDDDRNSANFIHVHFLFFVALITFIYRLN